MGFLLLEGCSQPINVGVHNQEQRVLERVGASEAKRLGEISKLKK